MDKTPSSVIIVVPPGKHSSIIKKLKELKASKWKVPHRYSL